MDNKTIVITGASSGIGKELLNYFISKKILNIAVLHRGNNNNINEMIEILQKEYKELTLKAYCVDISIQEDVEKIFKNIKNDFGSIDILVNNAAVPGPVGKIDAINIIDYKHTLDVNLYGSLYCIIESVKYMKKNLYGKIINLCGAGVGWNTNSINKSAYITSKHALYGLSESLSSELTQYNIDINCISPGSYNTKLSAKLNSNKNNNAQDLDSVGDTIGELIMFLISSKADAISGKIFSSIYDKPKFLYENIDMIKSTADYTIRKIDNINFKRL